MDESQLDGIMDLFFGGPDRTRERNRIMGYDAEQAQFLADFSQPWDRDYTLDETADERLGLPAILDHVDTQRLLEAFATGALAGLLTEPAPGRFQTEPPEGSVLKWVKTLGSRGREYTYVALRAGGKWYLTGRTSHGITFAELVAEIGDSPCDLATDWAKIPTPEPSSSENMSPAQWYLAMYPSETVDSDEIRESE